MLAGRSGIKPMIRARPFQTGNLCTTNGEKCLSILSGSSSAEVNEALFALH